MQHHSLAAIISATLLAGACATGSTPSDPVTAAEVKVDRLAEQLDTAERNLADARKDVRQARNQAQKAQSRLNRAERDQKKARQRVERAERELNTARINLGDMLRESGAPTTGSR